MPQGSALGRLLFSIHMHSSWEYCGITFAIDFCCTEAAKTCTVWDKWFPNRSLISDLRLHHWLAELRLQMEKTQAMFIAQRVDNYRWQIIWLSVALTLRRRLIVQAWSYLSLNVYVDRLHILPKIWSAPASKKRPLDFCYEAYHLSVIQIDLLHRNRMPFSALFPRQNSFYVCLNVVFGLL